MKIITKQAESFLEAVVNELEIPVTRYEQAERSYLSLATWLHREESVVSDYAPDVFVQGSFMLGTVIKPQSQDEEYDVDCVCSLTNLNKSQLTQKNLKEHLGYEINLYRKSKGISKNVHEGRRCWRLEYADGAQFHMDIVPSIPNGFDTRRLLESKRLDAKYADTAIAITDNEVLPQYIEVTDDWPRSNPRGYADWFKSRMADTFTKRREQVLQEMRKQDIAASIEDIPTYRVRTPLQSAIMILKRHRDVMFEKDTRNKPISIIISTLAAHAYREEPTIGHALLSILERMEETIEFDGSKYFIRNPTDPLENFADKWEIHPERAQAFGEWLENARGHFFGVGSLVEHQQITTVLEQAIGDEFASQASDRIRKKRASQSSLLAAATSGTAAATPNVSFSDAPRNPKKPDGFA